jgi:hypothetical protein
MDKHHHENLKIIAFVGNEASDVVAYLTEKRYPKISKIDMASQIEHLAGAGQHRIVTSELSDVDTYHALRHEFPGEIYLVNAGDANDELAQMAHHHISNDHAAINELLEKLDFTL